MATSDEYREGYRAGFFDATTKLRAEMRVAFVEFETEIELLRDQLAELRAEHKRTKPPFKVV